MISNNPVSNLTNISKISYRNNSIVEIIFDMEPRKYNWNCFWIFDNNWYVKYSCYLNFHRTYNNNEYVVDIFSVYRQRKKPENYSERFQDFYIDIILLTEDQVITIDTMIYHLYNNYRQLFDDNYNRYILRNL